MLIDWVKDWTTWTSQSVVKLLRLLVDEVVYDDGHVTIRTILPIEQLYPISGRLEPVLSLSKGWG